MLEKRGPRLAPGGRVQYCRVCPKPLPLGSRFSGAQGVGVLVRKYPWNSDSWTEES